MSGKDYNWDCRVLLIGPYGPWHCFCLVNFLGSWWWRHRGVLLLPDQYQIGLTHERTGLEIRIGAKCSVRFGLVACGTAFAWFLF